MYVTKLYLKANCRIVVGLSIKVVAFLAFPLLSRNKLLAGLATGISVIKGVGSLVRISVKFFAESRFLFSVRALTICSWFVRTRLCIKLREEKNSFSVYEAGICASSLG